MKKLYTFLAVISVFAFVLQGCQKEDFSSSDTRNYSGEFVRDYYTLQCKVTKETPGFFPTQAARAFAYTGITVYEAVYRGIPGAVSLGGQLNGLSVNALPPAETGNEYNWGMVANAAIAETMRKMYELKISNENLSAINSMEENNQADLSSGTPTTTAERSVQLGKDIATAIYEYSKTDGGHESYLDPFQLPFTLPVGSHCWVPTGAAPQPLSPYWGANRPFMEINVSQTQPIPHIPFSIDPSSAFYAEAMATYNQVTNNTPEQADIARFWADDPFATCTPAGHTFNILSQLLEETDATLEKTAVAYAKLGIAENDAFISCWKTKYDYVLIRPVTYIRTYIDPSFSTVIGTPPFPAYTSGHSCEVGVGSSIFTELFTNGDGNYNLADRSQLQYGFSVRNFSNFDEMALECANSRFYGGIHYPMDNFLGLQTGKDIGDNVVNNLVWPSDVQ